MSAVSSASFAIDFGGVVCGRLLCAVAAAGGEEGEQGESGYDFG